MDFDTVVRCSELAAEAFSKEGGHQGTYLGKPWKNSRIYIDARKVRGRLNFEQVNKVEH